MSIDMFLNKIVNAENRKELDIRKLSESTLPLVIYGAGNLALGIMKLLNRHKIKIDAACVDAEFIRSDSCSVLGVKVTTIENICKKYDNFNVLIGFADYDKARNKLKNIQNVVSAIFIDDVLHHLEFFNYQYITEHLNDFEFTYNLLQDQLSKDIFIAYINAKISGEPDGLYELMDKNQYFNDLIQFGNHEVFVDCGAFDGDTIIRFHKKMGGNYKKIYAFEPDEHNYCRLQRTIVENEIKHVHTINKGCWDKKDVLLFSSDANMASTVSLQGDFSIEVDTIDNIVGQEIVTFLKMDIEGSELAALRGAEKTIKKSKPKLAICVYHKPEDLITIPQFISSLVPEYKFFLRHHQYISTETVLYAIIT